MQPVPGVYRASYQGCGGGSVVQLLLCFPSAGFYSCGMWFFFFICMFNATLINQTLVITIIVRIGVFKAEYSVLILEFPENELQQTG